jgi:cell division septum initiation protein DivIVA
MSYFHRPAAGLEEPEAPHEPPKSPFADVAGRFANWISGVERMPDDTYDEPEGAPAGDPMRELSPGPGAEEPSRFPVAPFGYSRAAVEEHIIGLEREIAELRAREPEPMSINEELERIGEQTASILVVAHDKAHETTRLAQEQAERCVADAAANAVAITNNAKQRLRELDSETDSVWRERERLLEDVRRVSSALVTLADDASARFPAAEPSPTTVFPIAAGHDAGSEPQATVRFTPGADDAEAVDPQATVAFSPGYDEDDDHEPPVAASGDTGSWLTGLEPPEPPAHAG